MTSAAQCRFCSRSTLYSFVDLGLTPLSNAFVKEEHLGKYEAFYPLHAYVCASCFLVQLEQFESPEHIFGDYAYFSSFSSSWLAHAERYAHQVTSAFGLDKHSNVVEIASNDGYLLRYFKQSGIRVLGIEPAGNVAEAAIERGIPTVIDFFGSKLASELTRQGRGADLLIGNNVLAHVPDLNDFISGMKILLNENGIITMEFPHLLQLMLHNQFDTIYHEHFSYFSLLTVKHVFASHGLVIFDVEELSTHGGSLRIYAKHETDGTKQETERLRKLIEQERTYKLDTLQAYLVFSEQVKQVKRDIWKCLIGLKNKGKQMVGYGAPAKGNTLLNYCGVGKDVIDYVVDRNPYKQGLYLPGTRIPIYPPNRIRETEPDVVIIMPWNLSDEVITQTGYIRQWGGQWLRLIPEPEVLE
ncbi:SAM-dependent methyltransferase [Paenibacillus larvae subsp. pulvifaciens]|nr:class I SAM-dependent methyltransferase [Paenibacillus larvae]AQT86794.1 SAM-dependent methyltransferase [Paenibacillus larvae subsp. pulvifaciens]AQZ49078.1 SAM-dependent methyltransferase [Paenibacillus larvae subsp. pulvifaciens]MBH0343110.1 SAM-dependent methyltransferase [Paenibacillus larvae]MCY7519888.1 class I SAM-dependent methyltransferase [Paenibacillus larvae]MCY9499816.1 class I SAM-dependent methyltransferase [Paenibacillus larvae]